MPAPDYLSKPDSHLSILYGNVAPEGSVAKITGKEGLHFEGKARVFHSEEDALQAILDDNGGGSLITIVPSKTSKKAWPPRWRSTRGWTAIGSSPRAPATVAT